MLVIKIMKFKQDLVDFVNNSELPFCVIQMILREVSNAVNEMAKQEYEKAMEKMNKETDKEGTNHEEPEG